MEDPKKGESAAGRISFHYLKSNSFKTICVDGAHGGISPRGRLNMSVFSERLPIPKEEIFENHEGSFSRIGLIGKEGVIREVEATLSMDYTTMVSIRDWLSEKISDFEKRYKIEHYSPEKDQE
ncbi:MAG: hypothetical protein HY804_00070 [Nitrospinae bacterium]|nr:hypothetical protein [Nitrospinota bacterium]